MRWMVLAAVLLLAAPTPAGATVRTDQLLWKCTGQDSPAELGVLFCVGFISGFIDAFAITESMTNRKVRSFCLPKKGTFPKSTLLIEQENDRE